MFVLLAQNFDQFNPLFIDESAKAEQFRTPSGIITEVLRFAFPIAGFILFVMLVWGGFEIMISSVSGKKDAGKQRITTAIIGFILLFATFWIGQLMEAVFGARILN